MLKQIVWLHNDCLSPTNPALQAYSDMPAIFVWDEAWLRYETPSLKRLVFMYECLLECPVTIRRGDVVKEVLDFAQDQNAQTIITVESPSPRFSQIVHQLRQQIDEIRICPISPFLTTDEQIDLRRFSRYWRTARRYVFNVTL